ncbi:MAG TPA: FAD-dependent oxidoreductase [Candidatus Paceibacterota bacterium]|nr:FAD-dependent oxidoreductase [Verrucomicrobiota bacterium]HRY50178.1 FAD-dependent oxidoreductase [Candidatus Paceibacterota bacterium]HSA02315.1 FAD-dependent oxidoreductase [Candidatus Paceibacterota bacterium]
MPLKVVIVGGVAAGPKVAAKIMRLNPEAEVTVLEQGKFLSYAGCGLPYYVSGMVREQKDLMSTAVGVVRDTAFFQKVKNVRVLNETEAIEIDRAQKRVRARRLGETADLWLPYDKLVLATGARPVFPPLPNVKLKNVFTLHGMHDAEAIKTLLAQAKARDVVIIGGGLIGVETTEALVHCGCRVTIVEMLPQILGMLDWEMARLVERHMESHGVKIMTDTQVTALEGDDRVCGVSTTRGSLPADMVILAIGVRPNVDLARAAHLALGPTGGIQVDDTLRTNDPNIYAVGDCVEGKNLQTGQPCYVPLGSTANKQGRVAAINICGGQDRFPGVLGSAVCKVFDFCVARTGLTEKSARQHGHEIITVVVPDFDRAHYMPGSQLIMLKLIVDAPTRKLMGAQAVGPGAGDKRMDVAAMAITAGMTVDQLAKADLCYAPPYATALDNIITAANVARNKLDGLVSGITAMEVKQRLDAKDDFVFLDVRSPAEHQQERLPHSVLIPLGALRSRLSELPKEKEIVAFCKVSLRGYEAAKILQGAGYTRVRVMDGGVVAWPFEKAG